MYIYEHIYTFVHSVKIVAKETVIILNQELPTVLHAKRDLIYESLQLGLVNCREGAKAPAQPSSLLLFLLLGDVNTLLSGLLAIVL